MVQAQVSGIECLDPPPLGNVDLRDAVRQLNGRIFIKGNVDPVNTLLRGDADKVRRDVSAILETAGHEMRGFILSSACSVAPPVNPEWQKKNSGEKALTQWKGVRGLAEDVRYYGQWMRDEVEKRIGHLYPKIEITPAMTKERLMRARLSG